MRSGADTPSRQSIGACYSIIGNSGCSRGCNSNISQSAVLIHSVGVDDGAPAVLLYVTVMVPVAFIEPQPPVKAML